MEKQEYSRKNVVQRDIAEEYSTVQLEQAVQHGTAKVYKGVQMDNRARYLGHTGGYSTVQHDDNVRYSRRIQGWGWFRIHV